MNIDNPETTPEKCAGKIPLERLVISVKSLLEEGKPACGNADECFCDGRWGWFAFDDPLNNAAGGKPWCECYCATDAQREAVEAVRNLVKDDAVWQFVADELKSFSKMIGGK